MVELGKVTTEPRVDWGIVAIDRQIMPKFTGNRVKYRPVQSLPVAFINWTLQVDSDKVVLDSGETEQAQFLNPLLNLKSI